MKITIHRGTNQIGGCITEYEQDGWRVFVDYGEQLPGNEHQKLEIDGLNQGDLSKSALFITHYHIDHVGNIEELSESLQIYMGEVSKEILCELSNHLKTISNKKALLVKRLESVKTFKAGEVIKFGNFLITPFTLDHSAFDAYAFKIEAGCLKAFHTGDFRTHGFRSGKLFKLLDKYVGKVDYVVCEGTNVARPEVSNKSEHELQTEYEEAFRNNKGSIVYVSTTNIDRLFSLYHAALKVGKPFYVDPFQKRIMDIVTQRDNLWGKSRLYKYGKYEPIALKYDKNEYLFTKEFEDFINEKGYVLMARATDRFDNLIDKLPGEKKTYLSMWHGYVEPKFNSYNPRLVKSLDEDTLYLHTSGHTDMGSLFRFFEALNPKAIIPIHTDNPNRFANLFSNRWPVLLLNDGDYFNPIDDSRVDGVTSSIFAVKELKSDIKVISFENSEKCYSLDAKIIGNFRNEKDALFGLHAIQYAPKRILGYSNDEEEDMEPSIINTYTSNLTLNVNGIYGNGKHSPGGEEFQTSTRFQPGDGVLCVLRHLNVVFPAIYEGPITLDSLKEWYDNDEMSKIYYDSFEDFVKEGLWDCDWDSVIVRPLVKIDNEEWYDKMLVRRPFVFPYKQFDI
ncbi:MAG: hypothetical protein J1F13_02460 [Prevotellaceae bacterium]|nr:hypothetical protein [Prevotellaceae bacterium]